MPNTVISYPIPIYQNIPINSDYYIPNRFVISAITRGYTTLVQTSVDHNYVVGQLIRLVIPQNCGIRQLNNQLAYVIEIPSDDQVKLDINSLNMDAFVFQSNGTQAQILAIGDNNEGYVSTTGRIINNPAIQGSFINISPN